MWRDDWRAHDGRVELRVHVDDRSSPISGSVSVGGQAEPVRGWLGLMHAISESLTSSNQAPDGLGGDLGPVREPELGEDV